MWSSSFSSRADSRLARISFNLRYAEYVDFLADPEFVANGSLPGGPRSGGATLPPWRGLDPFLPVKRQVIAIFTD